MRRLCAYLLRQEVYAAHVFYLSIQNMQQAKHINKVEEVHDCVVIIHERPAMQQMYLTCEKFALWVPPIEYDSGHPGERWFIICVRLGTYQSETNSGFLEEFFWS